MDYFSWVFASAGAGWECCSGQEDEPDRANATWSGGVERWEAEQAAAWSWIRGRWRDAQQHPPSALFVSGTWILYYHQRLHWFYEFSILVFPILVRKCSLITVQHSSSKLGLIGICGRLPMISSVKWDIIFRFLIGFVYLAELHLTICNWLNCSFAGTGSPWFQNLHV